MTLPAALDWWDSGERFYQSALDTIPDGDLDRPSLLPGWSRRHVTAHVARNADALVNLLVWARTGVETPMYPSPEARDAGIAGTASLPAGELREEYAAAVRRLSQAVRGHPEGAWAAQVRTAQGRAVPASEVPWMRCREVWVHAVDLGSGAGFAGIPEDLLAALVDDVMAMWGRAGRLPDIRCVSGPHAWGGGSVTVSGPLPRLAAWLTGRGAAGGLTFDGPVPLLPAWL